MKGAIERVTNVKSLGFYSRLFLVPKKTGDLQPVIDLSTLNRHMVVPHFKMETQGSIRSAIRSQDWTISIDIHDAYLHVPMHPAVRKYLCFVVNKKVYQFTCLPFGLATSPREFTKLLRPVVSLLRQLHVYLDDWLIRADTPEQAQLHTQTTIKVLQFLGWIISFEKSDLTPSQDFQFIGMQFNTRRFTVVPLPKMRVKVQSVHQHWMANRNITARDLHRLLGMLVFMASLVRRGRLRLRPVQWWAATAWCQRTGNWSDRIQVPQWVLSEVAWWSSPAVLQGLPLATKETEVTLFTDASSSGWEAQLGSRSTQGQWSASQRLCHINVLEMQAVIYAVRDFLPHLRYRVVRLMCDNAVTVVYIKNEGGTRSHTLMQMTIRLLKWCDSKAITLVPVHLPGVRNIQADSLSRVGQTRQRSGRWPWRVYNPCLPSGANHRSIFFRHSPTDDSSSSYRHIRTPGRSGQMPCPCPGTRRGAFCTPSRRSRWSLKFCRRSLNHQECRWYWSLNCNWQHYGSQSWWTYPKKIRFRCCRRSRPADTRGVHGRGRDWDASLPAVKSSRVETLRAILRAKGHSREAANMMLRCLRESSQQVYVSHWSRFVVFCRRKRWHMFRVRSHHFSTYMMHLFRDGLLPSTIISHRTSVASVLRHWVYDPAADPHIKLLVRAFRLERPVQCRIMPKWDLHLVLLSLLRPPFTSQSEEDGESSDDVISLRWRMLKCVFLLALASARWRSYLHALSIAPGRCVRERKHSTSTCDISTSGTWLPGEESATDAGPWMDHGTWDRPLESDGTGANVMSRAAAEALHTGLGKNPGGPAANVHSLEPQHQRYHEEPHKPMDRGDCQGSLHSSWSSVWPCDIAWGPSTFSFMGVQLSGGFTWHPVSGFLEVIWGLPELVPAWHGLYCWGHVNTGSSGGRTTRRGSRASSPTSIAYTICMQPLLRRS